LNVIAESLAQELGLSTDDPLLEELEDCLADIVAKPLLAEAGKDLDTIKSIIDGLVNTPIENRTIELYLEFETNFGQVLNLKKFYKAPKDPVTNLSPVKYLVFHRKLVTLIEARRNSL